MEICDFGWLGKSKTISDYIKGKSTTLGSLARNYLLKKGVKESEFYALASRGGTWAIYDHLVTENKTRFVLIWDKTYEQAQPGITIRVLDSSFWKFVTDNIPSIKYDKTDSSKSYHQTSFNMTEKYREQQERNQQSGILLHKTVPPEQFYKTLDEVISLLNNGGKK